MIYLKSTLMLFFSVCLLANVFSQEYYGKDKDIQQILKNINSFSQYYMNAEYKKLAACYTDDGKIFPDNTDIIEGLKDIEQRWILPDNVKTLRHKVTPQEIRIIKKYAYDYGYYEGETLTAEGEKVSWKGKYVIVWRKVGKDWKIYLDIWNRVKE